MGAEQTYPGERPVPRAGMALAVTFGLVVTALLGLTLMLGGPKRRGKAR